MSTRWSRREALKACLLPAGAIGAQWLLGCGDEAASPGTQAGTTGSAGSTAGNSAAGQGGASGQIGGGTGGGAVARAGAGATAGASGSGASAGASGAPASSAGAGAGGVGQAGGGAGGVGGSAGASGSAGVAGVGAPGLAWATGGTKSMTGNYPDPFATGAAGTPCTLYPAQTLGPCYSAMPAMREDISDGVTGLPLRLSFLVVRADGCTPVPNASVDIWHSGFDGIYSAFATGTVCNPSTMDVRGETFCRGIRSTNEQGRVDFSTIFPGWYTGRTIHIHFTVRLNDRASITSQLYFEDALTDEILGQGEYAARGARNTTNAGDSTFRSGGATPAQVLFTTAKRPDGVLHAWKVLSIA